MMEGLYDKRKYLGAKRKPREFKEEYGKNIRQSRRIIEENKRGELPGRYTAKMLHG